MSLNLATLREANLSRCSRWHPLNSWTPADWGVAMAGEAGEVCNAIKKMRRMTDGIVGNNDPANTADAVAAIGDEIADTLIYLDLLAARLDINLTDVVVAKFNKVSERNGFPERLVAAGQLAIMN